MAQPTTRPTIEDIQEHIDLATMTTSFAVKLRWAKNRSADSLLVRKLDALIDAADDLFGVAYVCRQVERDLFDTNPFDFS